MERGGRGPGWPGARAAVASAGRSAGPGPDSGSGQLCPADYPFIVPVQGDGWAPRWRGAGGGKAVPLGRPLGHKAPRRASWPFVTSGLGGAEPAPAQSRAWFTGRPCAGGHAWGCTLAAQAAGASRAEPRALRQAQPPEGGPQGLRWGLQGGGVRTPGCKWTEPRVWVRLGPELLLLAPGEPLRLSEASPAEAQVCVSISGQHAFPE